MRFLTWAGLLAGLSLVSSVSGSPPDRSGNFYTRIRANDAPIAGRFSIYAYMLDSLDAVVEMPGPGRVLAVNVREATGKNSFLVPGDLHLLGSRKETWDRGFLPLSEDRFAGLLDKEASRWALWWVPFDSLSWEAPAELRLVYGFARSPFVPLKDKDTEATLRALPWDRIAEVRLSAERPTSRLVRAPNPAAFDHPPRVRTRKSPVYPKTSRKFDFEGDVHVMASIDEEGMVTDAYVIHSNAAHELNVAALVAVMDWTFRPGKKGGIPVAGDIVIPVQFALGTVR